VDNAAYNGELRCARVLAIRDRRVFASGDFPRGDAPVFLTVRVDDPARRLRYRDARVIGHDCVAVRAAVFHH
jgi:hypothetical protein